MPVRKDPWFAANLSWTVAGLGQFYAGRKRAGIVFLALDLLGIVAYILWLVSRDFTLLGLGAVFLGTMFVRLASLLHARKVVLRDNLALPEAPATPPEKNPWKAFFMTRFISGLGHAYAGKRIRAFFGFLLFVGWGLAKPPEAWATATFVGFTLLSSLVLLDSFYVLRKSNGVPRRLTLTALVLILAATQTFVIAKFIQIFAFEVFRIPSSAMEPTLLGNVSERHTREGCPFRSSHIDSDGDRILVSKLAFLGAPIERFDVVVFRHPLNQSKFFVSRVVGMPGEEFQIHQGDVYARLKGEKQFRILRKPMRTQDSLWIRVDGVERSLEGAAAFRENWDLATGNPGDYSVQPGVLEMKSAGELSFKLKTAIDDAMGQDVEDVRVAMEFDLSAAGAEVFVGRSTRHARFSLRISAGGKGELRVEGLGAKRSFPFSYPALSAGQRHQMELLVFDGTVSARLDGIVRANDAFIDVLEDSATDREPNSGVSFGTIGGSGHVFGLGIGRDLCYRGRNRSLALGDDQPIKIPEGSYLTLGDNVANSHDCRAWVKRTFKLKDGRTIVCEQQQINESYSDFCRILQERHGLPQTPDLGIDGDEHGDEVPLFRSQIESEGEPEPFRFVDRRFIAGRVQKIWWPLSRAGPVR